MALLDSAKSVAGKTADLAAAVLGKLEELVKKLEGKGGPVGTVATGSNKVIGTVKDKLPTTSDTADKATEPPDTVAGADPEGPTEFGTTIE